MFSGYIMTKYSVSGNYKLSLCNRFGNLTYCDTNRRTDTAAVKRIVINGTNSSGATAATQTHSTDIPPTFRPPSSHSVRFPVNGTLPVYLDPHSSLVQHAREWWTVIILYHICFFLVVECVVLCAYLCCSSTGAICDNIFAILNE